MQEKTLRHAFLTLLLAAAPAAIAPAMQIELGLNLIYDTPSDPGSGGVWQVIGRSSDLGIHSVSFALTDVNSTFELDAPSGTVNGADTAGFAVLFSDASGADLQLAIGHPLGASTGSDVGRFYGFGSIENGSPDFPTAPAGANTFPGSPTLTSLTIDPGELPWATGDTLGDPAFDAFAQIASGTFAAGQTPAFDANPGLFQGRVFTSFDAASTLDGTSNPSSTDVFRLPTRTNLTLADYNQDLVIDAADYVAFRDTLGASLTNGEGADGDSSGQVDLPDHGVWVADFGASVNGSAVASASASAVVPEPTAAWLSYAAAGLLVGRSRRRTERLQPRYFQGFLA